MAGRPTVKTDEIVRKIEEVAALDGSIEEMAYYSGVHVSTVYRWMEEDEELKDRITALRERPVLKARQEVVKGLTNYQNAMDYLKRKKKLEFSERTELSGPDGKDLPTPILGAITKDYVSKDDSSGQDTETREQS